MNKYNLHKILTSWGKSQRQLPDNNESLKKSLLANLPNSPTIKDTGLIHRAPWLSMSLIGLAVLVLIITPSSINRMNPPISGAPYMDNYGDDSRDSASPITSTAINSPETKTSSAGKFMENSMSPNVQNAKPSYVLPDIYPEPPYYNDPAPINDTREFLKTSYNATIRTRKVNEISQHIQIAVRGVGGRIDGFTSSNKNGYINFAIPADKLDFFVADIKNLVPKKFFVETTMVENLLPQKQSIERQQEQIYKMLATLNSNRDQLIITHKNYAASIQRQLDDIAIETDALKSVITDDLIRQTEIAARLQELSILKSSLKSQLTNENYSYNKKLASLDSQIKNYQDSLEYNYKQDQKLIDNVATVRGTIYINWIGYWEIIGLYTPSYWPSIVLVAAAIIAYINYRRKSRNIIP
ncbi:MAG: hypothetical protein Q8Q37_03015 [bacterium]|nr:hypothetical protein [bacterium]